jgi:TPR repeat protein
MDAPRPGFLDAAHAADLDTLGLSMLAKEAIAFVKAVGMYRSKDYVQALPLFRELDGRGFFAGSLFVGVMRSRGLGTRVNFASAYPYLLRAAEAGDAEAQFQVGRYKRDGIGAPADKGEATVWFTRAARRGDADARAALRELGQNPDSILTIYSEIQVALARGDRRRALEIASDPLNVKSIEGSYTASRMLMNGDGVPKNVRAALPLIEHGIRLGSNGSMWNLGILAFGGKIIKVAPAESMMWYLLTDQSKYTSKDAGILLNNYQAAVRELRPADRPVVVRVMADIAQWRPDLIK